MTDDTSAPATTDPTTQDEPGSPIAAQSPAADAGLHLRTLRSWLLARTGSPSLGAPVTLLVGGAVVSGVAVHRSTFARVAGAADPVDAGFFETWAADHELEAVDAEPWQVDTVHLANATVAGVAVGALDVAVARVDGWSPTAEVGLEGIWDSHQLRD